MFVTGAATAAFLIKLPIFLSHMWLPKAHTEAPVAGSMFLAATLLKLGGCGLVRVTQFISPNLVSLAIILISLSSLV